MKQQVRLIEKQKLLYKQQLIRQFQTELQSTLLIGIIIAYDLTIVRLKTIENSDCIYVLDNGRIVEYGSHGELMAKQDQYYKLYKGTQDL